MRTPSPARSLLARALAPSLATFGALGAFACADAPPAPGALPTEFDTTLSTIVVDVSRPVSASGAARPALALASPAGAAVIVSPPVDLGTVGIPTVLAGDVNDAAQVVGQDGGRASLWAPGRRIQSLATLGGEFGFAFGINATGQVVGSSDTETGESHAFLWTQLAGMQDLGTLGGSFSDAFDINGAGHVVGRSTIATGEEHAFLWTPERGMQDLGTLGGCCSQAFRLNNVGQVVGWSTTAGGTSRAFLWTSATGMQDLGAPGSLGDPIDINDFGQVVIGSTIGPFLWTADLGLQALPSLGFVGSPIDINESGQILGENAGSHFLWQRGTGMTPLPLAPLAGDERAVVSALNDRGHVVGWSIGQDPVAGDLKFRAVLWTVGFTEPGAPAVERLHAVVLPPGIVTGNDGAPLSGVWLRVRLRDPGDAGPWDWTIDWGDGVATTAENVTLRGEFAFLRPFGYLTPGPHPITVTATDPGGLTNEAATTSVP